MLFVFVLSVEETAPEEQVDEEWDEYETKKQAKCHVEVFLEDDIGQNSPIKTQKHIYQGKHGHPERCAFLLTTIFVGTFDKWWDSYSNSQHER